MVAIHGDDFVRQSDEEFAIDPDETAVPDSTAQDAPQDVAPAFIGGQDAVADHESDAPGMVGNDLQRDIDGRIRIVLFAGNVTGHLDQRVNEVRLEIGRLALDH